MRIAILTNEYPPNVYGGAGVHVEYLTRELARLDEGGTTWTCCASAIRPSRPRPSASKAFRPPPRFLRRTRGT